MSDGVHALFLDFDGTLVDIAERPDAVEVEPGLPELLIALKSRCGGALAIVTGRTVGDIDGLLPGLGLDICGLHGLERRIDGRIAPSGLPDLTDDIAALRARLGDLPGIVIEDKHVGVAVHWRMAPAFEDAVKDAIADLAVRLGPDYRVQDGKAVREILPASAGKGFAVRDLMSTAPYHARQPVFVGDDRTDEHGFEIVNGLGGVTIKIGAGPTRAHRRIGSPAEFRHWLAAWDRTGEMAGGLSPA